MYYTEAGRRAMEAMLGMKTIALATVEAAADNVRPTE